MACKHVALCCAFVTGAAREDRRTLTYRCPALHCTDPNTELWGGEIRLPRLCSASHAATQQFFAPQKCIRANCTCVMPPARRRPNDHWCLAMPGLQLRSIARCIECSSIAQAIEQLIADRITGALTATAFEHRRYKIRHSGERKDRYRNSTADTHWHRPSPLIGTVYHKK